MQDNLSALLIPRLKRPTLVLPQLPGIPAHPPPITPLKHCSPLPQRPLLHLDDLQQPASLGAELQTGLDLLQGVQQVVQQLLDVGGWAGVVAPGETVQPAGEQQAAGVQGLGVWGCGRLFLFEGGCWRGLCEAVWLAELAEWGLAPCLLLYWDCCQPADCRCRGRVSLIVNCE
jgi:hypothetical protein